MKCIIHPHKGYLNTSFILYHNGDSNEHFSINGINHSSSIKLSEVSPNTPVNITFDTPGQYELIHDGVSIQKLSVVDGYKFGGSSFKAAFLFEKTPWVFVVMNDRTYFHNRESGMEYVEAISPDSIEYASERYVILSNKSSSHFTLYDLDEEHPTLVFENLLFHNNKTIVWLEIENNTKRICLVNFLDVKNIRKIECDDFSISKELGAVFCFSHNNIFKIAINNDFDDERISCNGNFIMFIYERFYVSMTRESELSIVNLSDMSIRQIQYAGTLFRINGKTLIGIQEQINRAIEFSRALNESTITLDYVALEIFPSDSMLTYTETSEYVKVCKGRESWTSETRLCNEKGKCVAEVSHNYSIYTFNKLICLVSNSELYVVGSLYGRLLKHENVKQIYTTPGGIYVTIDSCNNKDKLININQNGYLDPVKGISQIGDNMYSLNLLENYGVIRQKDTDNLLRVNRNYSYKIGKYKGWKADSIIFDLGIVLKSGKSIETPFAHFSSEGNFGLEICDKKVFLFKKKEICRKSPKDGFEKTQILIDLFDSSKYRNVLLSEDGSMILSRLSGQSQMLDVKTGNITEFDNIPLVAQINGIRPSFKCDKNRQVRIINPITGIELNISELSQYVFISPKGTYYADTELDQYIEYYNLIDEKLISEEDYKKLEKVYSYPIFGDKKNRDIIAANRKLFIENNYDFLVGRLPRVEKSREKNIEFLLDKESIYNTSWFLDFFVERRGVAVIRKATDKTISHRINLGTPLWFLNYVAFSQDEKYVAIAGRYPNNSGYGGLLLIHELENNKTVYIEKESYAVWLASFSRNGKIGAYTSTPTTFLGEPPFSKDDLILIKGYSFLTFSPDGSLLALSKQGYTPWNDGKNINWGHQPSCLVSIRKDNNPNEEIIAFDDLSDRGIEGVATKAATVSSVSFSNNNNCVMMTDRDGVVVIRNLNLEDNSR